ncbi:hypothetical protein RU12_22580 [Salmonella enterica]|nr:hypothetical protein [Salmonella enterica]
MGRVKEWMMEELQQKQILADAMPQQLQWANQRIIELQNMLEETNLALDEANSPKRIWKERIVSAAVGVVVTWILGDVFPDILRSAYLYVISLL